MGADRVIGVQVNFTTEELKLGSTYYTETPGPGLQIRARIAFCVRFSLNLIADDDLTFVTEVNFQETVVAIFIDLTDGF